MVKIKKTTKRANVLAPKPKPKPARAVDQRVAAYVAARATPFDDRALGARVPDEYAFPTDTRRVHQSVRLSLASGGDLSFAATNNPLIGVVYNSSGVTTNAATVIAPAGIANNAAVSAATVRYAPAISSAQLRGLFTAYRVVGWGVRVKCSDNYAQVGGKIISAAVPGQGRLDCNGVLSGTFEAEGGAYSEATSASLDRLVWNTIGVPWDTNAQVDASILNHPGATQATMAELISMGAVEHAGRTTSSHATWFRPTSDSLATAEGVTLNDVNATAAAVTLSLGATQSEKDSLGGWSIGAFRLIGMPAGTDIEVELVYHLEGTPPINTAVAAGTAAVVTASAASAPFVVPGLIDALNVKMAATDLLRLVPSGSTFAQRTNRIVAGMRDPKTPYDNAARFAVRAMGQALGLGSLVNSILT